jgi:hypothetical protein
VGVQILVKHLVKGVNTVGISQLQKKWVVQGLAGFMCVFNLHELHFFFNAKNQREKFFQLSVFCKFVFYIGIDLFRSLDCVEAACKKNWLMGARPFLFN